MFTVPDQGEGDSNIQSTWFQEYVDVLVAGVNGIDCVLVGCGVTGGADMTPSVAKGAVLTNGVMKAVTLADVTIGTADATHPRIDLIVIDSAGAKQVRAGTAAAAPKPPARTANDVVLAAVYVPANDTTIGAGAITDMRVMRTQGPIVVHKVTSPVTFNTTSTIQTYVTLVIPNGLMLAGRILRFKAGGNYFSNSGTPTWTFTIAYGGTTFFADATAATALDAADRGAWSVEFDLIAQASNDEALNGLVRFQTPGTKTAPTTGGQGDLAVVTHVAAPFAGVAGTVDSDSADRTLTLQITMSVNNAAVETVMEYAYVELL